eukprot:GGOE01023365.1.p3 GENE.GGOE01023365.1~~GGOE01023365.1.p3  ORF type:complete len:120 (-),score=5.83 GGOE01023365.1:280-639(-)
MRILDAPLALLITVDEVPTNRRIPAPPCPVPSLFPVVHRWPTTTWDAYRRRFLSPCRSLTAFANIGPLQRQSPPTASSQTSALPPPIHTKPGQAQRLPYCHSTRRCVSAMAAMHDATIR